MLTQKVDGCQYEDSNSSSMVIDEDFYEQEYESKIVIIFCLIINFRYLMKIDVRYLH